MSGVDFVGKSAGLVTILEENDVTGSMETLDEACGAGESLVGSPANKTVPRGWSLAENGRVEAPDGKTYKNRRIALREMIISGLFSRAEVDLMRSCLKFEGWRPSQDIPDGWMTKSRNHNRNVLFVTGDGDLFESVSSAARFVEKYEKYFSPRDLDKIKKLKAKVNFKPKKKKMEQEIKKKTEPLTSTVEIVEVKKDEQLELPSGWQMRDCKGGGKIFVSSTGKKLNGISSALRFMVRHNLAEKEISQLREYSTKLGWKPEPTLPSNWFVKRGNSKTMYLGPSGEFFRTKEKMMCYLNIDVKTQQEKIKVKVEDTTVKKIKKSHEKSGRSSESWSPSDGTIPEGWKFKQSKDGNKMYLLTPEGKVIHGRRCALKFLVENNAEEEKILEMRNLLTDYDGWCTDSQLPQNWLYQVQRKNKETFFCSPTGERFRQKEKALQYLQNSGADDDDVAMLRDFTTSSTDANSGWSEGDGTIPAGWKMKEGRIGIRTFTMLLSPCGRQMKGRRAALTFMINNLYPESSIAHMRRALIQLHGWEEDPRLPEKWLITKNPRRRFRLCSPDGHQFESREKAIKYLRERSGSEEDVKKIVLATAVKSNRAKSTGKEDEIETLTAPEEEIHIDDGDITEEEIQSSEGDDINAMQSSEEEEEMQSSETDTFEATEEEVVLDDDSSFDQSTEDAGDISREISATDSRTYLKNPTLSLRSKKLYKDYSDLLSEKNLSSLVTVKAELSLLGWMEAPDLLPDHWLIRLKPGFTNINFLTPSGKTLKSLPHARRYVQDSGVQFEFKFEKLKERLVSF